MISKYWKLTDKVLSLSHENFNTQIYKTLKIVKNRRKFVNNYKKTSEKKTLFGRFDNYRCVPGCKSAFYDNNRHFTTTIN